MTHHEARQRRLRVLEAFKSGLSIKEVCERFKLSKSYAYSMACSAGVLPDNRPLVPNRTYYVIADLCYSTDNQETIGARWGLTKQRVSQIYQHCVEAGLPVQPRTRGQSLRRS